MNDDCGNKRAIHVANRCSNKLHGVSAKRPAAMTDDTLLPFDLHLWCKRLTVDFDGSNQSSDGGLLLCERRIANSRCVGGLRKRCRIVAIQIASGTRCSR